ncbi:MAG: class I SAM-dependent methyltransferase [Planctomycetota bacterium]
MGDDPGTRRCATDRDDDRARLARAWSGERGGAAWRATRWGGRARAQRDPRAVAKLLAARLDRPSVVLDVACGTGRLRGSIVGAGHRWIGVDASADQLLAGEGSRLRASAFRLPFADDAVDAAVACRFLHHLRSVADLDRAVAELVRVARRVVVVSFWDRATWPYAVRLGRERDASGRVGRDAARVAAAFRSAGASIVAIHRPVWRLSAQTFVAAVPAGGSADGA